MISEDKIMIHYLTWFFNFHILLKVLISSNLENSFKIKDLKRKFINISGKNNLKKEIS